MAENGTTTDPVEQGSAFDAIKDQIQFSGFTDEQEATILSQLERAYETESGRAMIDDGLANHGLHYNNANSSAVIDALVAEGQAAGRPETASAYLNGDFAIPRNYGIPGRDGQLFLSSYDSIDPATGQPEIYNYPGLPQDGQAAVGTDPILSLDQEGDVIELDPTYILIHETNHSARDVRDIIDDGADGFGNDLQNGKYYSGPYITDPTQTPDYMGVNETDTQVIMREMGYTDLRGSYIGTFLDGRGAGEEFGMSREFDTTLTTGGNIDMRAHAPQDALVVNTDRGGNMFLGDGDDVGHGLGGNDGFVMGGGNDIGFGGLGNDVFVAGRGLDVIDGGEADVSPGATNRESDSVTDWGFDAVSYQQLDIGGGPAGILEANLSFDGTARDGIFIEIDGRDGQVLKGSEAGATVEQADSLRNIDAVVGTRRDDLAEVASLDGDILLDGSDGTDTLRLDSMDPDTLTQVPGAGTFNGQPYQGFFTDGTSNLYYNNYENFVLPEVETSAIADSDASASGITTPGADAVLPDTEAAPSTLEASVTLPHIVSQLDEDHHEIHSHIAASAEDATLTLEDAHLGKMMSQTGTAEMFRVLDEAGIESLTLPEHDAGSAMERTRAALEAGARAMVENDLPFPDSEYVPEQDPTGLDNEQYEAAAAAGPEEGTLMIHEALHIQQHQETPSHEASHGQQIEAEAGFDLVH